MGSSVKSLKGSVATGGTGLGAMTTGQGLQVNNFTATAAQTAFALGWSPASIAEVLCFIDGSQVTIGYSFTVAGTTLTVSPGLDLNMKLTVVGAAGIVPRTDLSGAMSHPTLLGTGNGSTVDFALPTAGGEEFVWAGGGAIQIRGTDYTVVTVGTVAYARFGVAPLAGVKIHGSGAVTLLPTADAQTLQNHPASYFAVEATTTAALAVNTAAIAALATTTENTELAALLAFGGYN